MTARIGIMGGMFDPVHRGHITAARLAKSLLDLDQVRLIPCSQPSHRDGAFANQQQRSRMLALATADDPQLVVDEREYQCAGPSYTFDTVCSLQEEFPGSQLVLILGLDSFRNLPGWYRWKELFDVCHMAVVFRPDNPGEDKQSSRFASCVEELKSREVSSVKRLFENKSGNIYMIAEANIELSSSEIRHKIASGEFVDSLVGREIKNFIQTEKIYHR